MGWVKCSLCSKSFLKDNQHINENIKLQHKFYCSLKCQSSFKSKQKESQCSNPHCKNLFTRKISSLGPYNFCSRSCAASVNNSIYPKRLKLFKLCINCNRSYSGYGKKYCSVKCKEQHQIITGDEIIKQIRIFFKSYQRIPLKREFKHYMAARKRFGNWTNTIKACGFTPNPILFANRQVAKDSHICDSLAEKIIDDYLYEKGIPHERNSPYPEGTYRADFKIGDKLVEYFGLSGELIRYDELKEIKRKLVKKYRLKLIEIYPDNLFPISKLDKLLF